MGVELLYFRLKFGPDREKGSFVGLHPAVTAFQALAVISRERSTLFIGIASRKVQAKEEAKKVIPTYLNITITVICVYPAG